MIRHEMVLVYQFDGRGQRFPYFGLDIALDVTTHEPDDIGLVLVSVGEEGAILLRILHTQFTVFHQSAPDAYHSDIDAVLGGHINDIVHVIPVAIDTFAIDVLEVPAVDIRHLTIDVIGWYTINGLYLYDVIACFGTRLQIPLNLSPVEPFRQQPAGIAQPKERFSVFKLQIALVIRHT